MARNAQREMQHSSHVHVSSEMTRPRPLKNVPQTGNAHLISHSFVLFFFFSSFCFDFFFQKGVCFVFSKGFVFFSKELNSFPKVFF